ncbi:MAG TPA: HTH domain-containing protein [Pyrinomonadaceae bacterium]
MSWTPKTFDEAIKRAAGRRAYNRKRRLEREARIARILRLLDSEELTGRELAVLMEVHEATISRDLRFIKRLRRNFRRMVAPFDVQMKAHHFRWLEGGSYKLSFTG